MFVSFRYREENRQARLSIYLWHRWLGEPDIGAIRPINAGGPDHIQAKGAIVCFSHDANQRAWPRCFAGALVARAVMWA
jgi:hypothetical protein